MKRLLYLICTLSDFTGFIVVFAVTRQLAELRVAPWHLGLAGAGFAFSSGMANVVGGLLSHRFGGRSVFLGGTLILLSAVMACGLGDPASPVFLPLYWAVGMGLGCIYPTLIGWLNRGEDAHTNRRGVSRTLILFCISWNVGMMSGQLIGGALFDWGLAWTLGTALVAATLNVVLAVRAVGMVGSPETQQTIADAADVTEPVGSPLQRQAVGFKRLGWIANLGSTFGGSLLFHLLPDLAVTIGIPADSHGSLLAYWRLVIIATYVLMHCVGFWHYRFSTSIVSQMLGIAGLIVIARAESAAALFVGLTLHGQLAGYNYFSGLYYSTAGSVQKQRTLAAGIHEATLAAGMALGTIAGGILGTTVGHRTPYLLAAMVVAGLIAVQCAVWWRWVVMASRDSAVTLAEQPT